MNPCSTDYKVVNLHARQGDYSMLKNAFCSLFNRFPLDICKHILDYFSSIDENRKILKRIEHLLLYVDFLYLDTFKRYKMIDTEETCIFYAYNTYLIRINPEELLYFKNVLKSPDKVQLCTLLEAYIIAVYALEYMLGIYEHIDELRRCLIPHYEEKALGVNIKNEEDYFMYEIDKYNTPYVYERATRAVSYVRKLGIKEAYSKITNDTSTQKHKVKSLYNQIQIIIGKYGYNWEPMQNYTSGCCRNCVR
jgi:hypothetical protein